MASPSRILHAAFAGCVVAGALCLVQSPVASQSPTPWTILDLGTLGGKTTTAPGIGASGLFVAGTSVTVSGARHAFRWSLQEGMRDLGTLGGLESEAMFVTPGGLVVGRAQIASGEYHAFVSDGATLTDLGTLGGSESVAYGANDAGVVVGASRTAGGVKTAAFIYREGRMTTPTSWRVEDRVGSLPAAEWTGEWAEDSAALAVNDAGHVVGSVSGPAGERRVFLYIDGVATIRGPFTTGKAQAHSDVPVAIAGTDDVAAYTTNVGPPSYAAAWNGPGLGGRFTYPRGIDATGRVVGEAETSEGSRHAVVWRQGAVTDVNTLVAPDSGWVLESATGIDTSGTIVGYGTLNGETRAFRLVPPAEVTGATASESGSPSPSTVQRMVAGSPDAAVPTTSSGAGTYNIRVVTDASPDLTDLGSFVASTTSEWPTAREKVWALFYWSHMLKRQTAPMVLHGYEVTDPVRNFNDFGFTMCSTISGINQALYETLGLRHQFWDICNHTVSAVEYDAMFHMVDSSMSNLVTRDDGVTLAPVEEVAADSARLAKLHSLYSTSPNGFLTGTDTARNLSPFVTPGGGILPGYSGVFCADGLKRRDYYYNWSAGHRYVLNLRENESYTRYYRRLGETPEYWVGSETIGNADPANRYQIDASNRFGLRGNGSWSFTPSLSAGAYARAVYGQTNIAADAAGGLRPAVAGRVGEVIYKVDAANAMTSQQIRALFSRTDAQASAVLSISVNHGQTWREVARLGTATGAGLPLNANLRDEVSGQTEALVRVQMTTVSAAADALVLQSLRIDTITQVNAKALPKLNIGKNRIHIGAGDQSGTMSLWPDLRGDLWKQDAYASANVGSQPVTLPSPWDGAVFPADASREASLTYRMEAPGDLTKLVYGGRLHNRGSGSHIEYWHSFDGGQTWILSYRLIDTTQPWDVIHYETVTDIPPGTRSVLFKYTMHSDGLTAGNPGIFSLRMEAQYQPAVTGARPVEITFRWNEIQADRSRVARSHKQQVTAFPFEYDIDVGGVDHPVMESLRVNLDGAGDSAPLGYGDGVDVGGERYLHRWRTDGSNVAAGRSYTFSRAPSGFQSSAGASNTTVLTDGVVGAPQTGGTSYYWGQCWSGSSPLALTVDLGQTRAVGAARVHLFGYPGWDALAGEVQDRVELLTSADGATYVSRGTFDTWIRRKDVPINYMLMDDEHATAWNFELLLPSQVQARYVRYQIDSPRILCASELQVFDNVDVSPFDLHIALPPAGQDQTPAVTLTAPADGATVSGRTSVAATATGGTFSSVSFDASGATIGRDTTSPYSLDWDTTTVPNGSYTLTAQATTSSGQVVVSAPRSVTVANTGAVLPRAGWIATASNNPGAAPNAIDGDARSRWDTAAAQTNGQWFQVDMLAPRTFDRVVLDASGSPGDYPRGYRISVSDTGSAWVDVASGTGSSAIVDVPLPSQTRRYVRITQTGSSGSWWSIHEVQLYSAGGVPPSGPTPYLGTPVSLPGTVEAEGFDNGGNGVAYADSSPANQGGAYRTTEAVDIEGTPGNYDVGWIDTGEWLLFSVNVATTGTYRARLRVASPLAAGTGQVSLAFGAFTSPVVGIPNTGSWASYQEVVIGGLPLTAGTQFMRVNAVHSGWNLDKVVIEREAATSTAYLGTPVSLPGTVEAENFDNGGSGVAYWDSSPANQGGAYRPAEAVDIEGTPGNYDVGWIDTGEWLAYSVNVTAAGTYRARLRVASPLAANTGQVSLTIGGVTSPPVGIPSTGSWASYQEITIAGLALTAGTQILRVNAVHSGWNLDRIVIEPETAATFPVIEAEAYQSMSGIVNAGSYIGYVDAGDWARYAGVDFGSGARSVAIRVAVASTYAGRQIQFRLDSVTGPLIGTLTVQSTAGWYTYQTQTTSITGASGVHDLYLVFAGGDGVGNIDWFQFGS